MRCVIRYQGVGLTYVSSDDLARNLLSSAAKRLGTLESRSDWVEYQLSIGALRIMWEPTEFLLGRICFDHNRNCSWAFSSSRFGLALG